MYLRPVLGAVVAAAVLFALTVFTKSASHDRDWQPHLAVAPSVTIDEKALTVAPVRDWTYTADGPATMDWYRAGETLDPDKLEAVWFVVEPHPGFDAMAHTLVLFEFSDNQLIGLTVEAKKQRHEKFAPVAGAFRRFELAYVWATPRDLLVRRALYLDHEVYIYPLDLTPEQEKAYLLSVLDRTAEIHARPRFYSTLHSNCTNELAKSAGLSWDPAFILTGTADEALYEKGLITGASFEAAQIGADMTSIIRSLKDRDAAEFNTRLLETLRPIPS